MMSPRRTAVLMVGDSIQSTAAEIRAIRRKRKPLSHISFGFCRSFIPMKLGHVLVSRPDYHAVTTLPTFRFSVCFEHQRLDYRHMKGPALFRRLRWLGRIATVVLAASKVQAAQPDDWPRYGHDPGLTGRSSLHGKIATPKILWSFSTAGSELEL